MEKDPQRNVSESSKKKGPSDYYFWVLEEVKNAYSLYTDQNILDHFLRDCSIAHLTKEHFVVCFPCKPNDWVCHIGKLTDDKEPVFLFVYDIFFSTLGVRLPFTPFEAKCLDFINVTPSEIHPNSWAFIRAFEVLTELLDAILTIRVLLFLF